MENKVVVSHQKGHGHRHVGNTKWSEVRKTQDDPVIDDENPEIAFKKGKIFVRSNKKINR